MSALKNFSLLATSVLAVSMAAPSEQMLVNTYHPLEPSNYAPATLLTPDVPLLSSPDDIEMSLAPNAGNHVQQLFAAASHAGFSLVLSSG